jgi:hypothetical protein
LNTTSVKNLDYEFFPPFPETALNIARMAFAILTESAILFDGLKIHCTHLDALSYAQISIAFAKDRSGKLPSRSLLFFIISAPLATI